MGLVELERHSTKRKLPLYFFSVLYAMICLSKLSLPISIVARAMATVSKPYGDIQMCDIVRIERFIQFLGFELY